MKQPRNNKKKQTTSMPSFEEWLKEFRVSSQYVDPNVKKMIEFDDVINYARSLKSIGFNGQKYS